MQEKVECWHSYELLFGVVLQSSKDKFMCAVPLETELEEKIQHSMEIYKEGELNDVSGMSSGVCISWYWRS